MTPEKLIETVFPPMLASLVAAPPADESGWLLELKYDGFRALAGLAGGRVALWSRNRLDLAGRFAQVAGALAELDVGDAVLDGEICAFDTRGRSRFQLLQEGAGAGLVYVVFDLLWLDGADLRARPLEERRERLERLLADAPNGLALSKRVAGPAARALAEAARRGEEGLILKARGSRYEGKRAKTWLKLKALLNQEVAIVGYELLDGATDQIGSLVVAVAEGRKLRFAGKVGTGFSTAVRRELLAKLAPDRVDEAPVVDPPKLRDAIWVEPRLVAQVRFTEWTRDDKLRHPSFQGLRADKAPLDCVRERPSEASE